MEVDPKNEDNFPLGLHALLLAIEEIEGTQSNNEQMESNNLSCNTHEKSLFNYSETFSTKSPTENKSSNDKNSLENGKPTEDIFPFGLDALLVAIEEIEGIQTNNEHVQSNKLSDKTHDVDSCFICPDFSSVKSSIEKKASHYSTSDLDTSYEPPLKCGKKTSAAYTISNIPITLPKQSLNQENKTYFHTSKLSEKSDISPTFKKEISLQQICSECGEIVELLNDDLTFSLEVHLQSHKVIYESNDLSPELIYDKNVDYMCPDCNMSITVFNSDIDFSLEHHYSNYQHGEMSKTPEERIKRNKFTDEVFLCLGDAFKADYCNILFDGSELYCRVCKCGIVTSEDIFKTSVSLRAHLSLLYHKDLVSVLDEAEEPPVDLSKNWNNSECHYGNQKGKLPREGSVIPSNASMSWESSIQKSNVPNDYVAEDYKETLEFTDITKFIPKKYNIHSKFFSFSKEGIYCNICSHYVASMQYLTSHVITVSHKIAFFNQIKENMPNEERSQVKCLIIVGEQLICTSCKDEITLLNNFDSVCAKVLAHFQSSSHRQRGP